MQTINFNSFLVKRGGLFTAVKLEICVKSEELERIKLNFGVGELAFSTKARKIMKVLKQKPGLRFYFIITKVFFIFPLLHPRKGYAAWTHERFHHWGFSKEKKLYFFLFYQASKMFWIIWKKRSQQFLWACFSTSTIMHSWYVYS